MTAAAPSLELLLELSAKATRGPWESDEGQVRPAPESPDRVTVAYCSGEGSPQGEADADFIAAAVNYTRAALQADPVAVAWIYTYCGQVRMVELTEPPRNHVSFTEVTPLYSAPLAFAGDDEEARHWIERYAAGVDDEPQMERIRTAYTAPPTDALPAALNPNWAEWPLFDKVEFALRDAGFDYDEAFALARKASQPTDEAPATGDDSLRAALLWALYHHQGGSSGVGQVARRALGMSQHQHMTDEQIREATRYAALTSPDATP